jgi:hypothetical protein
MRPPKGADGDRGASSNEAAVEGAGGGGALATGRAVADAVAEGVDTITDGADAPPPEGSLGEREQAAAVATAKHAETRRAARIAQCIFARRAAIASRSFG